MGWTSTDARFYTADGKINRRAECDNLYTWEDERRANKVLKSSMRGSVYYAAVQTTDKSTGSKEVFAVVCLTSTRWDGGFNFGYKGMTEDMGPCEDDCPKGILDLLTDTESKYAKEWRERCRAKLRDKKQSCQSLSSVKIGEEIEFEYGGRTIRAEKMAPAYQFKTPWFKVVGELEYIAKTRIKDWRIVAEAEANEPVKHISEIMETCRLHDEETGEETDEYRYYKWLAYCHTSGNYRTIADKALAEALTGIYVAAYRKGKGHITAMNRDGVLVETVISATPTETPQISTQTAETVNVSVVGDSVAETKEMPQILNCEWQIVEHFKTIPNIAKLAKAGIIINGVGWHTEYLDQAHKTLARVDNLGWDMTMHTFPYQGSGVFGKTELFENWEDAVIATIDALTDYLHTRGTEPPQSSETPQKVECIADAPKPRETAWEPQNRSIGSTRTTQCDTLRPVTYVPRECSTADYW